MMSWSPIWAMVLRHLRMLRRDINFLLGTLYWPLLDILIWGFVGAWIQKSSASQLPNYEAVALLGVLLWQIVGRGCNIMAISFIEELWSNNVVNLFSLPISIKEWMAGIVLFTAIMIFMIAGFCMLFISLLYDVSITNLLSTYIIFMPPLLLSSIWIGFSCLQVIVTLGKRGAELGFVFAWFLMPFSGAFYPVEVLPQWAQTLSACLPFSYAFQGMRGYVMYQHDPTPYLVKAYVLGALYATIALIGFVYCFNRTKQAGLARLAD